VTVDLPTLLGVLKRVGGSDLHISGGAPPMARVDGVVRRLALRGAEVESYPPLDVRQLVYGVLKDAQKKRLEANRQIDTSITIGGVGRFRANIFFQDRGLAAVFRAIPDKVVPAEKLGLPPVVRALAGAERGLVLVTGPTGSGKSTTLCSLVDDANRTRCGHIITIEDPIEFVHRPQSCMVNQREVGTDVPSFADALRAALREDPDIILVGEMRDRETIALAITAAETGHLVFGTLHTASAAKTVDRVVNVFSEGEQAQIRAMFAESIQAVVAQQLLPRRGGGRVAAFEVLVATSAVRALIRDAKTYQLPSVIQTGARYGMQSLEQALSKLVMAGLVDREVAAHKLAALGLERDEPAGGAAGGPSAGISARPAPASQPAPPTPQPPPGGVSGRYAVPGGGGAGPAGGVSGRFPPPGGGAAGSSGGLSGRYGRPGGELPPERRKTD
jgi:twitching motility protein PilT